MLFITDDVVNAFPAYNIFVRQWIPKLEIYARTDCLNLVFRVYPMTPLTSMVNIDVKKNETCSRMWGCGV